MVLFSSGYYSDYRVIGLYDITEEEAQEIYIKYQNAIKEYLDKKENSVHRKLWQAMLNLHSIRGDKSLQELPDYLKLSEEYAIEVDKFIQENKYPDIADFLPKSKEISFHEVNMGY